MLFQDRLGGGDEAMANDEVQIENRGLVEKIKALTKNLEDTKVQHKK